MRTDDPTAFEALVRWNHPELGLVLPGLFLSYAERSGLIIPLGYRLFEMACAQEIVWSNSQPGLPTPVISVNLSRRQFQAVDLLERLRSITKRTGANPQHLILEVTETTIFHDEKDATHILSELKDLGFRIALDDFGTGQSSLGSLHKLPIDILKIDKSFVDALSIHDDASANVIVAAMIDLADRLGLQSVAEGVESESQLQTLKAMGCLHIQGFLLGRPKPPESAPVRSVIPRPRAVGSLTKSRSVR